MQKYIYNIYETSSLQHLINQYTMSQDYIILNIQNAKIGIIKTASLTAK